MRAFIPSLHDVYAETCLLVAMNATCKITQIEAVYHAPSLLDYMRYTTI